MRSVVPQVAEVRLAQYLMGTVVEISARSPGGEAHCRESVEAAMREFERIERLFNRFDSASELSRVNAGASRRAVEVSEEFFGLASRGIQYTRHSGGTFSVTIQPLVALWEESAHAGKIPERSQIEEAILLSDPSAVVLDAASRTIQLNHSGVSLNFDGIAKGYAVDRACAALKSRGIEDAVIDAGSSSVSRISTATEEWPMAIRHPGNESRAAKVITRRNAASTSGTSQRGFELMERWHSHVIDPRNGEPLSRICSATAFTDFAELSEVAAKVVLIAGCRAGLRICDNLGWDVEALTLAEGPGKGLVLEHPAGLRVATGEHT